MELRRAILLFAIVLGLAAVATSVSRQPDDKRGQARSETTADPASDPTANPRPAPDAVRQVRFDAGGRGGTRSLPAGRAATVTVSVPEAGEVELAGLGLVAPAEPLTPARFEVLTTVPDRYEVRFAPVAGGEGRTVGVLQVTP